MLDISEFDDKLAARLAKRAGLPNEHARKFLNALADVTKEDEQRRNLLAESPEIALRFFAKYGTLPGEVPTHVISIPVVEHEDGTMAIDRSSYSAWTSLTKPIPRVKTPSRKTTPKFPEPRPIDPPDEPSVPHHPRVPAPGGYPGPSIFIKVNDWLGKDLDFGAEALGRFHKALGNVVINEVKTGK